MQVGFLLRSPTANLPGPTLIELHRAVAHACTLRAAAGVAQLAWRRRVAALRAVKAAVGSSQERAEVLSEYTKRTAEHKVFLVGDHGWLLRASTHAHPGSASHEAGGVASSCRIETPRLQVNGTSEVQVWHPGWHTRAAEYRQTSQCGFPKFT